ncbi:MAG TPA: cutinase family protein [Mycobacterium sp.]|nr:cutinase family protein [Mycobacterium sp.]
MRKSLAGLYVGAALISGMLIAPAVSFADSGDFHTAREGSCPDIQVVFARGTDEPPGPGRVGQAFVDSLRSLVNGKSVARYAVDYPASYDFLRALDGANDARQFVESTASSCPQAKEVLDGYLQGAASIDLITVPGQAASGLGDPLPENIAEHVAAVAVFGNPSNRMGGLLTVLGPLFGYKAIDLCNGTVPGVFSRRQRSGAPRLCRVGMATETAEFAAGRLTAE